MILVRNKGAYVGTLQTKDFLKYAKLDKMPEKYHYGDTFVLFYEEGDLKFYTIPFIKKKSNLNVRFYNGRWMIHDRTCRGCPLCKGASFTSF